MLIILYTVIICDYKIGYPMILRYPHLWSARMPGIDQSYGCEQETSAKVFVSSNASWQRSRQEFDVGDITLLETHSITFPMNPFQHVEKWSLVFEANASTWSLIETLYIVGWFMVQLGSNRFNSVQHVFLDAGANGNLPSGHHRPRPLHWRLVPEPLGWASSDHRRRLQGLPYKVRH